MTLADATTEPTPQLAAQFAALEEALYAAQVAGSPAAVAPLLSADLRYLHSTGVAETREAYLAGMRERRYEYGSIHSRGARLLVSQDIAVQSGQVTMTVGAHGAAKTPVHLLFCLVWRREGAEWRLLYRQGTRIP